jgi:acyl phosphate:glycerol-3-phosphate acyltransferase
MQTAAAIFAAYCLGSISFAIVVSWLLRLPDPRSYGSKNPGATNVLRTGKKAAAALTLAGDAAKGTLAVLAARYFVPGEGAELAAAVAAVAVCLGHMYSAFLRFHGGKGVATAVGVLLGVNLYIAAGAIVTWVVIAVFFRISSFAALVAAAFVPIFSFFLYGMNGIALAPAIALTIVSLLLVWRHRTNIRNLLAGTEGRIGRGGGDAGAQDSGQA